jgi:general secretion pathway protein D
VEAISVFDVGVMKGMSFALVPARTSQPGALADALCTIFSSDREGPMAGMAQFSPNERLVAILLVSAQPKYLARAETWVRRLAPRPRAARSSSSPVRCATGAPGSGRRQGDEAC